MALGGHRVALLEEAKRVRGDPRLLGSGVVAQKRMLMAAMKPEELLIILPFRFTPLLGVFVGKVLEVLRRHVAQVTHHVHNFMVAEQWDDLAALLGRFAFELP